MEKKYLNLMLRTTRLELIECSGIMVQKEVKLQL